MLSISQPLLIYVYDIPKHLASSVLINKLIKEKTTTEERKHGLELPDPVQFKTQRVFG